MRTIKFRGIDNIMNEWLYGDLVQDGEAKYIVNVDENDHFNHEQVVPETVSQFTGLYDRNNKEIYEGDVVVFAKKHFRVRYNKDGFVLTDSNAKDCIISPLLCDVIGNVYDNPNLMEDETA